MADLAGTDAAFEGPPPRHRATSDGPQLQLGSYEGPLDLLLELARAQRVDLTRIAILPLVEQFIAAMEAAIAARRVPLTTIGDWLVTATTLLSLRARLLLPAESAAGQEAAREAALLRRQLADRALVQAQVAWLERRTQLGRDVFARGATLAEVSPMPVADVTELLRACLRLLQRSPRDRIYRPAPPPLWRVPDALARLREMLGELSPDGASLAALLPRQGSLVATPLQRRAALASTLMAGLELAREGAATLEQGEPFGEIRVGAAVPVPDPPAAPT
jgi:segregation and condensation protein A